MKPLLGDVWLSVHAFCCFKALGFVCSFADRGMRLEGPGPLNWIKGAKAASSDDAEVAFHLL